MRKNIPSYYHKRAFEKYCCSGQFFVNENVGDLNNPGWEGKKGSNLKSEVKGWKVTSQKERINFKEM